MVGLPVNQLHVVPHTSCEQLYGQHWCVSQRSSPTPMLTALVSKRCGAGDQATTADSWVTVNAVFWGGHTVELLRISEIRYEPAVSLALGRA